jgi:hypothetical protein
LWAVTKKEKILNELIFEKNLTPLDSMHLENF